MLVMAQLLALGFLFFFSFFFCLFVNRDHSSRVVKFKYATWLGDQAGLCDVIRFDWIGLWPEIFLFLIWITLIGQLFQIMFCC